MFVATDAVRVTTGLLEGAAYVATLAYAVALVFVLVKRGWSHPLVEVLDADGGPLIVIAFMAGAAAVALTSTDFGDAALLSMCSPPSQWL